MKTLQGDLLTFALNGTFDVIVHGNNCHCNMEAGVAKSIMTQFPEAFAADCATVAGDRGKLGNYTTARVRRGENVRFTVVNAYTQFHWKGKGTLVDYGAVRSIFRQVKQEFSGLRIGYLMIGAGMARGNWWIISAIIDEELADEDHTLVVSGPSPLPRHNHQNGASDEKKPSRKKLKNKKRR